MTWHKPLKHLRPTGAECGVVGVSCIDFEDWERDILPSYPWAGQDIFLLYEDDRREFSELTVCITPVDIDC